MKGFSLNKPAPLNLSILCGFALITLHIFEKLHSFRPPVYTAFYLTCDNFIPTALYTAIILWAFWNPPRVKPVKILMLVTLAILWVDMTVSYALMVGRTTAELRMVMHNWSMLQFLALGPLMGLSNQTLTFLVGWSFYKKTPWFFRYEKVSPLQNVLMKFISLLWLLYTLYELFQHAFALQAFRSSLF